MQTPSVADRIGGVLPYLRRYARSLTGSQERGDAYAALTLETILEAPESFDMDLEPKVALFRVFNTIWVSARAAADTAETELEKRAHLHLSQLTADTREALLLHTIEDFSVEEVAQVLRITDDEAQELIDIAYREMSKSSSGKVLIIEDEAVIYVDLEEIVTAMGHRVVGIARTEERAVELALEEAPDLILSDIQLADNSSGIDAVNRITEKLPNTPVIVVTAFPERLLTGETNEPAFLITKPYEEHQIRSAVSQAMFFSSVESLRV